MAFLSILVAYSVTKELERIVASMMRAANEVLMAILLIIGGIIAAVFGQSMENNLLLFGGLSVAVVGVIDFLILKVLGRF